MPKHLTVEEFRQKWVEQDPQALVSLCRGWIASPDEVPDVDFGRVPVEVHLGEGQ